jgi:hypothetical protein
MLTPNPAIFNSTITWILAQGYWFIVPLVSLPGGGGSDTIDFAINKMVERYTFCCSGQWRGNSSSPASSEQCRNEKLKTAVQSIQVAFLVKCTRPP